MTTRVDEQFLATAEQVARDRGISLGALVRRAVQRELDERALSALPGHGERMAAHG